MTDELIEELYHDIVRDDNDKFKIVNTKRELI